MSVNIFKNGILSKIAGAVGDAVPLINNFLTNQAGKGAADANTVYVLNNKITELNSSLTKIDVNVGLDGKLHFVDATGADTALNFSSAKVGSVVSSNYTWVNVNIGHEAKKVMVGGVGLSWLIYDESVSKTQFMASDGAKYDLETSSPNPCSFALTDTGFKIRRNYSDSITYYYMAV